MYIGSAMERMGGRDFQLWDEDDGFFYDVLRYPNGEFCKFRVRSLVGLIPLFAVDTLKRSGMHRHKAFFANLEWFLRNRADLVGNACIVRGEGDASHYLLSVIDSEQLARVLLRIVDPSEFLSPGGLRSLSKYHLEHPFRFGDVLLKYEPAESEQRIKGGNSNWRGPVWFPITYLMIESLVRFSDGLGPDFTIGDAGKTSPHSAARELAKRLIGLFKPDEHGRRPCYGGSEKFQTDPHWRNYLLFHEYFNGDDGAGLGASHQTGWTALVANLIDEWCGHTYWVGFRGNFKYGNRTHWSIIWSGSDIRRCLITGAPPASRSRPARLHRLKHQALPRALRSCKDLHCPGRTRCRSGSGAAGCDPWLQAFVVSNWCTA